MTWVQLTFHYGGQSLSARRLREIRKEGGTIRFRFSLIWRGPLILCQRVKKVVASSLKQIRQHFVTGRCWWNMLLFGLLLNLLLQGTFNFLRPKALLKTKEWGEIQWYHEETKLNHIWYCSTGGKRKQDMWQSLVAGVPRVCLGWKGNPWMWMNREVWRGAAVLLNSENEASRPAVTWMPWSCHLWLSS